MMPKNIYLFSVTAELYAKFYLLQGQTGGDYEVFEGFWHLKENHDFERHFFLLDCCMFLYA